MIEFQRIVFKTFVFAFRQQAKILEDLFTDIVRDYQFQIEKTHIQVIPGKLEGIYSWIAINYVLGRFQPNKNETGEVFPQNFVQFERQFVIFSFENRRSFGDDRAKTSTNGRNSRHGRRIGSDRL